MKKTFLFLILSLLLCSFAQADVEPLKITLAMVLAFLVGIYEVIVRIVPTAGQYAVIGKIIDILKWVSDFLNRKSR